MKRRISLSSLVLLPAFGCTAPEAQPSKVLVATLDLKAAQQAAAASDAPLRAAIVWVQEARTGAGVELAVGWDRAVGDRSRIEARFAIPDGIDWSRLRPSSSLRLPIWEVPETQSSEWRPFTGYRPRVIAYLDRDRDGQFGLDTEPGDRILALDSQARGVFALEDPRAVVAQLSLETASYYYHYAPGLNHFVFTELRNGALLLAEAAPVSLVVRTPAQNHFELSCGRSSSPVVHTANPRIELDNSLDLSAVCGLNSPECESVDLHAKPAPIWRESEVAPPESESEEAGLAAQCKRGGSLEALLIRRWAMSCANCSCTTQVDVEVYLADRDALPAWWPCGDELGYCRAGTLREFVYGCPLELDGPISDAGAEAGAIGAE